MPARRSAIAKQSFVRCSVTVARGPRAEWLAAEAFEAGACGLEERDAAEGAFTSLVVYAPAERAERLRCALTALLADDEHAGEPEPVPDTDWSQAWREGLCALEISPRLVVRPSFVAHTARPGQATLLVDPGQAFGTGGHASTRLALELLDAERAGLGPGTRVLDVGTGTGVLALAALRLGAGSAVGCDVDPVAAHSARENAARNALDRRLQVFAGSISALAPVRFPLVVANLLRRELAPLLGDVSAHLAPEGVALLSGLLADEVPALEPLLRGAGLRVESRRDLTDATGDRWSGLRVVPARAPARRRGVAPA